MNLDMEVSLSEKWILEREKQRLTFEEKSEDNLMIKSFLLKRNKVEIKNQVFDDETLNITTYQENKQHEIDEIELIFEENKQQEGK
ncbi:7448_t:CDS:2 [Scutellospora calospora]|uniref:7448_t:CDS:1 n=1 Tax=Scutellospora calospora TaxID=85575 RepID=A0ACA9LP90_9GLOM|nr:7448_t:CDS:2 [Scutellospora calospora]